MRLWPGTPYPLGATWDGAGTNFALFSEVAGRQLGIAKPATLFPGWSGGSAVGLMS